MTSDTHAPAAGPANGSLAQEDFRDLVDFFESSSIGLHWVDANGIILRANRADFESLGYTADEYIGRDIRDFHAETFIINDIFRRLLAGETVRDEPASLLCKDGSIRHVRIDSSGLFRDGVFIHTRCFTRDDTARHAAELNLRASEHRWRTIADAMPALVALSSPSGDITFFNKRFEEYTGVSASGLAGDGWLGVVHPDDQARDAERWQQTIASGETVQFEQRLRRADGVYRTHLCIGEPVKSETGEILFWIGVNVDIEDSHRMQDALGESELRYRSLAESMPLLVSTMTPDGRSTYFNRSWFAYTGIDPQAVPDQPWTEVMHPDDYAVVVPRWRAAGEQGEEVEGEFRVRAADGEYRWHLGRAIPLRRPGGGVDSWVVTAIDIHDRRRDELSHEVLAGLGITLDASLSMDELAETIVLALTPRLSQYTALYTLADDGVLCRYACGEGADGVEASRYPVGEGASTPVRRAMESGKETFIGAITDDLLVRSAATPEQLEQFRSLGLASAIVVPLRTQDGILGALSLSTGAGREAFDHRDLDLAREIARRLALAFENARLHERTRRAALRVQLLAEATAKLNESVDYLSTLQAVAQMAVPGFADWSSVHLVDDEGEPQQLAVAHADPAKVAWLLSLAHRASPPEPDDRYGVRRVIKTGQTEVISSINDDMLAFAIQDPALLEEVRGMQIRSSICVPLTVRGRVMGAITFVAAESGRHFDSDDTAFAEDLARRSAIAIDKAEIYRLAQVVAADLRRANAAKDEFLSLVSHELRTPITIIMGNAAVLTTRAAHVDEQERGVALSDIHREAQRLSRIIDNLLALARVEQQEALATEPISVGRVVTKVCDDHRRHHANRRLLLEIAQSPLLIEANEVYIEQALRNFLSNAEKYSPPGEAIEVTLDTAGGEIVVSVADRGIGIAEADMHTVFEPFFRSAKAETIDGIGIGLTVCKRLIEAHGGRIWARSRQGGGTVLSFALPATAPES